VANVCETTIAVVGLKEAPETFVKAFAKAVFALDLDNLEPKKWGEDDSLDGKTWYGSLVNEYSKHRYAARYCILYPHKPYNRLGVTVPRFFCATKWKPPVEEIREASKVFPDLKFHLEWWIEQDGPSGELVIRNGDDIDEMFRPASWYLFDQALLYPTVSLLPAHMPYTLAQRAALRVDDAIQTIEGLQQILDDDRFRKSQSRPFSDCRSKEKTEKLRLGLAALHESLVAQAKQLDFAGVFLEEKELTERYPAVVEADNALMRSLGLEPLLLVAGEAVRFSMLPFQVALAEDSHRVVAPVLHYANADPISGKYPKNPDGSITPIEWEIKYACLTPSEVRQIRRLPDEGQTPFGVDLIMTNAGDRGFGHEIYRASNRAMWTRNPEFRSQVEMEAIKVTNAFAAKVAGNPGIAIVDNFEAADATLFPKTNQVALPTADRGIDGAAI
jgi:hypothetical protein